MNGIRPGVYTVNRLTPYEFNETFGWITRKKSTYLRASPEYLHNNYYNPQGFPSTKEEKDQSINGKTPSVAFIGNSFVESYYVPYENSFPNKVKLALKHEVINLGVSGYSPGQYLLQSRKYLSQYNIKEVIIFFVPFQDIRVLLQPKFPGGYAKPVFGADLSHPSNTPLKNIPSIKKKTLEDYSSLATIAQPFFNKWFGHIHSSYKYQVSPDQTRYSELAMAGAFRYFKKIQDESQGKYKVTVVYIPAEFEYRNVEIVNSNFNNFTNVCRNMQMNCLIPDFFKQSLNDYQKLYYIEDHHISQIGSDMMAEYLIHYLKN